MHLICHCNVYILYDEKIVALHYQFIFMTYPSMSEWIQFNALKLLVKTLTNNTN